MVISVFFCIGLGIGANTASVALLARWLAELNGRVDKLEEAAKKQKTTQDRPVTEVVQHISKQFLAEASSISLNMTIHDEGPPRIETIAYITYDRSQHSTMPPVKNHSPVSAVKQ